MFKYSKTCPIIMILHGDCLVGHNQLVTVILDYLTALLEYRMVKNVGGKKLWRIETNSPKFFSPIFTIFNVHYRHVLFNIYEVAKTVNNLRVSSAGWLVFIGSQKRLVLMRWRMALIVKRRSIFTMQLYSQREINVGSLACELFISA